MSKRNYEDFPISLALFDALPVIFFSISVIIIAMNYRNALFIAGSILVTLAGLGKVIWKIIIAATRRDIAILNRQLRIIMPAGFILIIAGIIMGAGSIDINWLMSAILSFPAVIFFAITVIGMILMTIFAFRLDGTRLSSNWIEQITNAIAQASLLIGILAACFWD